MPHLTAAVKPDRHGFTDNYYLDTDPPGIPRNLGSARAAFHSGSTTGGRVSATPSVAAVRRGNPVWGSDGQLFARIIEGRRRQASGHGQAPRRSAAAAAKLAGPAQLHS